MSSTSCFASLNIPPKASGTKVNIPDPCSKLFQADVFLGEDRAKKDSPGVPRYAAVAVGASQLEVGRILERRKTVRPRTRRRGVVICRRHLTQRLVRPVVVVILAKAGEAALLGFT
jgi:hypothetical protein